MKHRPYRQLALVISSLALIIAAPLVSAAQERSVLGLAEIEGRGWLITPEGKPFFARGIIPESDANLTGAKRELLLLRMIDSATERFRPAESLPPPPFQDYCTHKQIVYDVHISAAYMKRAASDG